MSLESRNCFAIFPTNLETTPSNSTKVADPV